MNAVSLEHIESPETPEEPTGSDTDPITRLVLPEGQHISGELAEEFAQRARDEAGTTLRPVLLVISGVLNFSREARAVFSSSRSSSAIAVLGATSVDRVLANFLLGGGPPPCPTRYFSDEGAAVAWLLEHTDDS
ncbi:hypothetical protein BJ994_001804 [Arthrobacter pigmenti]|uniref:DUF7793 domain-containing protein n=1 Tax=Arthrobacter pigmenti TaxID=271432 RepID=A0A846RHL2_9MICC|nr:STAS/SEC14 domain-containing protein [Arthrobacter pigmenti]NJC22728.1 hypothetical protein [Arthrobacter pigmenti]